MDIKALLQAGADKGASDLHLSAGLPPLVRVDGDIQRLDLPALDAAQALALLREAMDDSQRAAFDRGEECDLAFALPETGRFRVNAFHHHRGPGGVFRYIPSKPPTLAELGLGQVFDVLAGTTQGLIAVTGPTGSGKSSTLAALVDSINASRRQHLLTIEDPIEFVHESKQCLVSQREVHRHSASFSEALRAALREDPDVILVGEMRDLATIRLALEAAETGHLVLATLHTASAAKTVDRIIDVFPAEEKTLARALVSEALSAVVAQTLVQKVGGGRVAAHEVMICTPAIRNLIREGKTAQIHSAMQTGGRQGMQTLEQSLSALAREGLVSQDSTEAQGQAPAAFG